MEITLINPPQATGYPQPPMGLAQLAAVAEAAGHRVTVIDANAKKLTGRMTASMTTTDIVGLTAMTPTAGAAIDIARLVRQRNPRAKIIL
ncbi:cobalamin-dependent protein, partial [Chloroflexota bacterium]